MSFLEELSQQNWTAILVAIFCGAFIGLERQLRGKAAGMRTSILICLGTLTFVELGVLSQTSTSDPTRVLGQVITGIGFLGGGVILTRGGTLAGVTSAAVIWVLASVGSTIGFGRFVHAITITFVTVAVLCGVNYVEARFGALRKEVHTASDVHERNRE